MALGNLTLLKIGKYKRAMVLTVITEFSIYRVRRLRLHRMRRPCGEN